MTTIENVKIIGQDHKGRGIAKLDGRVVFVDGALKGDICDVSVVKETKKYLEAIPISYKKEIKKEIACIYYNECGGCNILHQKYSEQLKFKTLKLKEIIKKFTSLDIELKEIIFDKQFNYRNKITIHNLGLYKKNTNQVVQINSCMLVSDKINEIIQRLIQHSKSTNSIIDEAMIRVSNTGEVLLDVDGRLQRKKFVDDFRDIDVLITNGKCVTEKDYIIDEINDMRFKVSSNSFYQVNRFVVDKLYNEVVKFYKNNNYKSVLDLYCGTGTISLLVAPFVEHVTGIEVVEDAIVNANDNKKLNNVENVEFICGKVEDYIQKFWNIDSVIVDPPRSGMDTKTILTLLKMSPKSIVYVSCDPVTLARDLKILIDEYEIESITPVDMFPNTYHVECVSVLHRKSLEK